MALFGFVVTAFLVVVLVVCALGALAGLYLFISNAKDGILTGEDAKYLIMGIFFLLGVALSIWLLTKLF